MYHQIHSFEICSLVNCAMLREMYNPHCYAILQYFYYSLHKNNPIDISRNFHIPPCPSLLITTNVLSVSMDLLFWTIHMNRII